MASNFHDEKKHCALIGIVHYRNERVHMKKSEIVLRGTLSTKSDLTVLKPVLEQWRDLVERYSSIATTENFKKADACYWASERSNVGILASAAWITGKNWIALEEFPTIKKGEHGSKKSGRCDLFIANEGRTFAFEAKMVSPLIDFGNEKAICEKIGGTFAGAWRDIGDVTADEADVRLAACFVVPRFKVNQFEGKRVDNLEGSINKVVESLEKFVQFDAMASVFPASSRDIEDAPKRYLYPGVCLLLRVRKRG